MVNETINVQNTNAMNIITSQDRITALEDELRQTKELLITRFNDGVEQGKRSENHRMKQWFVDETMEWEEGCDDGKIRFLEHLCLEDFLPTYTVTVSFDLEIGVCSDVQSVVDEIEYSISRNEFDGYTPYNVQVDYS
jgi:hypothetical protein